MPTLRTIIGFLAGFALALLLVFLVLPNARAADDGLYFVGNDDELNVALEAVARNEAGGVAVSEPFYLGSAKKTKDRLRGLMETAKENGMVLYFYSGTALDHRLAVELFGPAARPCKAPAVIIVMTTANVVETACSDPTVSFENFATEDIEYFMRVLIAAHYRNVDK